VRNELQRIVLAGGGTGGHLYPALSLAGELRRRRPDAAIAFIGARGGLEERLVPGAGYPLRLLRLAGLKGASVSGRLRAAAAAASAVGRCLFWMWREKPDLVVGVGGFASGPAVLAAWLLKVHTMVLEQNHFPGATNRWLGPRVDAVCLPSEEARPRIRGRHFVTGNPVREEFFHIGEPPGGRALSLLVFGGSRGAHRINEAMVDALAGLARIDPAPRIVHQTGPADETAVRAAYAAYPTGAYEVSAFLDDMPARLSAADLVLCRAGASTVAELCAAGRPAILVPYPHAADDHQRHNAESLVHAGAAEMVADGHLDGKTLAEAITTLAIDSDRRRVMRLAALRLARPRATARIADIAERLMEGGLDETA